MKLHLIHKGAMEQSKESGTVKKIHYKRIRQEVNFSLGNIRKFTCIFAYRSNEIWRLV
jgi:hypothetical protein